MPMAWPGGRSLVSFPPLRPYAWPRRCGRSSPVAHALASAPAARDRRPLPVPGEWKRWRRAVRQRRQEMRPPTSRGGRFCGHRRWLCSKRCRARCVRRRFSLGAHRAPYVACARPGGRGARCAAPALPACCHARYAALLLPACPHARRVACARRGRCGCAPQNRRMSGRHRVRGRGGAHHARHRHPTCARRDFHRHGALGAEQHPNGARRLACEALRSYGGCARSRRRRLASHAPPTVAALGAAHRRRGARPCADRRRDAPMSVRAAPPIARRCCAALRLRRRVFSVPRPGRRA